MSYMNLDSLKRYAQKEKKWSDEKFLSENDLNWQKTEKAGAVTCYPIGESPLEGTVEFKFKETLPTEGTKGPDNPSVITGVNSIAITRTNSNLIKWPYFNASGREHNDIIWTVNADGSLSATGLSSGRSDFGLQSPENAATLGIFLPQGTYLLSGCPANGAVGSKWALTYTVASFDTNNVIGNSDVGNGAIITVTNSAHISFFCSIWTGNNVSNLTFYPKLQLIESPFEKNEQEIYNINMNNTYYGGSIDLKTGLMTVTHVAVELNGTETWDNIGSNYNSSTGIGITRCYPEYLNLRKRPALDATTNSFCTHFSYLGNFGEPAIKDGTVTSPRMFYTASTNSTIGQARFAVPYSNIADFKAWLAAQKTAGTPVMLTYKIYEPFTVQLTLTQILSLPLLDKCTPRVNTLYTDADSIQVGYAKHPSRTAYELQQAIIAGGNH